MCDNDCKGRIGWKLFSSSFKNPWKSSNECFSFQSDFGSNGFSISVCFFSPFIEKKSGKAFVGMKTIGEVISHCQTRQVRFLSLVLLTRKVFYWGVESFGRPQNCCWMGPRSSFLFSQKTNSTPARVGWCSFPGKRTSWPDERNRYEKIKTYF